MTGLFARLWGAAASPRRFYGWLEPRPTRTLQSAAVAYGSLVVFALAGTLGFARATRSDALLPLVFFAIVGATGLFLYAWAFGSVFLQRPGALEGRAWEVTGWSWTPALFGSVSMLLPLVVAPLPALVVTGVGVVIWHLVTLRAGLAVFVGGRATRIATIYALYIYALPLALFALVIWFNVRLNG